MLDPSNIFAATLETPGLSVTINSGTVLVGGQLLFVPSVTLALTPNATNFIYFDIVSGNILVSTVRFPGDSYAIATAVTDAFAVRKLTDSRPDFLLSLA